MTHILFSDTVRRPLVSTHPTDPEFSFENWESVLSLKNVSPSDSDVLPSPHELTSNQQAPCLLTTKSAKYLHITHVGADWHISNVLSSSDGTSGSNPKLYHHAWLTEQKHLKPIVFRRKNSSLWKRSVIVGLLSMTLAHVISSKR